MKNINLRRLRSNILLIITAFIWGSAFVAQSVATDGVQPFTFNTMRSIVGAIVLLPVIAIFSKINKSEKKEVTGTKKDLIIGGIACGIVLAVASAFQQTGISMGASSGKAGFITAMYILIVPILGIFLKKRVGLKAWISVFLGVLGMYFLCMTKGDVSLSKADFHLIMCAFCFSLHIITIDHFSPKVDGVKMSCIQFVTCAIVSGIFMFFTETPSLNAILENWFPIFYTGAMSSGVAYTLQIIAQKDTNPVVASLIMSLESVFALLCGWVILHEIMSSREIIGCLLVFFGIILSQLPDFSKKSTKTKS